MFDMNAFLRDFQEQQSPELLAVMAVIHHMWKDHALKLEHVVHLVALSDNLIVDLADIQYIRKVQGDEYLISLKANNGSLYVYPDTPEHEGVQKLIAYVREH